MFDGGAEYSSASDCCYADITAVSSRNKSRNYNKRRFSDEQIRSLEVTFESEAKLDPRKKARLAKDLGLQPRQVAIWFQNKRARWKTKQIEKDYGVLMDDYNSLASQFECLKKEKQSLVIQFINLLEQLQKLKNEMEGESNEKTSHHHIHETTGNNNSYGESIQYSKDINFGTNHTSSKHVAGLFSDDNDISVKTEFTALPCVKTPLTSSEDWGTSLLTSSEEWGTSLDSDDQSYNHPWWEFWC
ncbi:hypothetical protein OROGR_031843 [Orobanche gracilis]